MTSNRNERGRPRNRLGDTASPKRPYATIDLPAKEVFDAPLSARPDAGGWSTGTWTTGRASDATSYEAAPAAAKATKGAPADAPAETAPITETATDSDHETSTAMNATRTAQSTPARSGSGIGRFFALLLAGLVGGLLALLGADQLRPRLAEVGQNLGMDVSFLNAENTALQNRLAALEQRVRQGAAPAANGLSSSALVDQLRATDQRLGQLEQTLQSLEGRASAGGAETAARLAADVRALQEKLDQQPGSQDTATRIERLEDTLAQLATAGRAPGAGPVPQIAALTGRMTDLEGTLNTQISALRSDLSEVIEKRSAQAAQAGEAAVSGTKRLDREVAGVRTDVAQLGQRLETLSADGQRVASVLQATKEEAASLRSQLTALQSDLDSKLRAVARPADVTAAVEPFSGKLASIEKTLENVVQGEANRRVNAERIVLSLELANLKRAIERGEGFASELGSVQKAAGGRVDLSALAAHKDNGVATLPELINDFRPVVRKMLDVAEDPSSGTVIDRLLAGAKSVVRVRKVDYAPGDKSPEAVISRMEKALDDNRLADVVAEAGTLPARVASVGQDWLQRVTARHTVDRAIATVEDQLKASLAGGESAAAKSSN